MNIYTIYDSKSESYMRPIFCKTNGEALRIFTDIANDPGHSVGMHPEDYTLFLIGEFSEFDGEIKPSDAKQSLGLALDFTKVENQPKLQEVKVS